MAQSETQLGAWLVPGWLEARVAQLGADPECNRRLRNRVLKRGMALEAAKELLPPAIREDAGLGDPLTLVEQHASALDGATKCLFRTAEGHLIESVRMQIQSGRATLCVSSQAGCAVRCAFCATGQTPVVKNLSTAQILAQVLHAVQAFAAGGQRLRNVVFMGMGEPLHNEKALYASLEALCSPQHFDLSPRHIMVSTVGVPDAMLRLARAMPKIGLALSLHSAQPKVRQQLIPWSSRYMLEELRQVLAACNRLQSRPIMLEYLLLQGLTDTEDAIEALLDFCQGLRVRINLIPYNPVPHASFERTPPDRQRAIVRTIAANGYEVTQRRSLGQDIAAACGQLVRESQLVLGKRRRGNGAMGSCVKSG